MSQLWNTDHARGTTQVVMPGATLVEVVWYAVA